MLLVLKRTPLGVGTSARQCKHQDRLGTYRQARGINEKREFGEIVKDNFGLLLYCLGLKGAEYLGTVIMMLASTRSGQLQSLLPFHTTKRSISAAINFRNSPGVCW
jgi:hypothetical protein